VEASDIFLAKLIFVSSGNIYRHFFDFYSQIVTAPGGHSGPSVGTFRRELQQGTYSKEPSARNLLQGTFRKEPSEKNLQKGTFRKEPSVRNLL